MTPGTTISHYRVTGELGRGGMGIVYKAEDTKLDRTVALKLLPPHALVSEDDKARFYREARAAAALNHPNIAHVYEIDEAEVAAGDVRPFIAMEYIDGETMADRIAKGPIPLKEAISHASQMAEGLKAAHRKDVVHRDVKSGNMMLTSDGTIKILDFGLAKTAASTKLTQMGSTLGTVAYMSPEQARGEEVDRRSDIWSLGVILYEMITGVLPFRGDYEQAVVYGILNEDPDSMTNLRAGVPMTLDGVIGKMLAKDPDLRYQNVDELPADLKAIDLGSAISRSRISTGSRSAIAAAPAAAATQPSEPAPLARHKKPWYVHPALIGVAALLIGAGAGFVLRGTSAENDRPIRRLSLPTMGITDAQFPTVSPNGEYVAFTGTDTTLQLGTLFIYEHASGRTYRFPEITSRPSFMSYSPDGRWLLYSTSGGVYRVLVPDGQPIQIVGDDDGATWESMDSIILEGEGGTLRRVPVGGGTPEVLAKPDSTLNHAELLAPSMIFGTDVLLAMARRSDGEWDVLAVDVTTGSYTVLLQEAAVARYIPTGHVLYMRDIDNISGQLAVRPFDVDRVSFTGPPVPVPVGEQNYYHFGFGLDGTFIYTDFSETTNESQAEWIDLNGSRVGALPLESARFDLPAISPDGTRLALERFNESENQWDIYVYELADGTPLRLSFVGTSENPAWTPDGRYVVFDGDRNGKRVLLRKTADGSGTEEPYPIGQAPARTPEVSPDGSLIFFDAPGTDDRDLLAFHMADSTVSVVSDALDLQNDPSSSPDGRFVVYETQETGSSQIFVKQVGGNAFWEISEGSMSSGDPMWSHDGEYIYFEQQGSRLLRVRVQTEPTFRRLSRPELVADFATDIDFALHPDGERILILSNQMGGVEVNNGLQVVQNWFEEVKQMAPVSGK